MTTPKPKYTRPALSIQFTNLLRDLQKADKAFSDALDRQGAHQKAGKPDKKLTKHLDELERSTSDKADRAWHAFCRHRPKSPDELSLYLLTTLQHERVVSMCHGDLTLADAPFCMHILKNAGAATVDLLFEPAR
ncbi:MAG TPA: hypothetical protein VHW69_14490 [Rhizomicrobium sp.]|jgi:hypothetical protein|nr:hypothetical protein [Rhizomicrobium sp.]